MFRVHQAPHHVRIEIQAGEIKKENTLLEFGKLRIENTAMFRQHRASLLQILFVIEHATRKGLCVLGYALRVELSYLFAEHPGIFRWRRDGQCRIPWINVDGRDIQLKSRVGLLQVETAYPL